MTVDTPRRLRMFEHGPYVVAVEELETGARYILGVRGGPQDPLPELRVALATDLAERCKSWDEAIQRSHIALGVAIAGGARDAQVVHKGVSRPLTRPHFAVDDALRLRTALGELSDEHEQTLERLADALHFLAAYAAAAVRSPKHRAPVWRVLEELAHVGRRLNVDGILPNGPLRSARDELLHLRDVPPPLVGELQALVALLHRLLTTPNAKD